MSSLFKVALAAVVLCAAQSRAESGPFNFHVEPGVTIPMSAGGTGFGIAAKLDVPVAGALAVQAQGVSMTLPRDVRPNNVWGAGLGVRVRLLDDHKGYLLHARGDTRTGNWFGNVWFDGGVLLTGSTAFNRLGVDVGVGGESSLIEGFQLGPFLKFTNADAVSMMTIGLSLSFGADPADEAPQDQDHDGITDAADKCPNQAEDKDGFKDDDGCPDPDNDGDNIVDAKDKCPNQAEDFDGFQDDDGCADPDNDNDGVLDVNDKCPMEPEDKDGFQDEDGCPDPDNDGDGILDAADKCPMQAEDKDGFQDEDGCPDPDNDGDGILDAQDKCPTEAETVNGIDDSDGCPEKTQVYIRKDRIVITDKVFFQTNKAKIQSQSFGLLDAVADVFKKFPAIKLVRVEGHTDDVGDDAYNQKLSEQRAQAVLDYLVSKGVEKTRLQMAGFGKTRPLDSAGTDAAREKNRRVEFVIVDPAGGLEVENRQVVEPGQKPPEGATPATEQTK